MPKELSHARLTSLIDYGPETGRFTWKVPKHPARKGDACGCIGNKGYRVIKIDGQAYLAHRLAWLYMTGSWPPEQIDHANRDRADNRFSNLRAASQSQNNANRVLSEKCGVTFNPRLVNRPYRAAIVCRGVRHELGHFATSASAAAAYRSAALALFGEFHGLPKEEG